MTPADRGRSADSLFNSYDYYFGKEKPMTKDAFIASLRAPIKTWVDYVAPRQFRWLACVGDYDLDAKVGQGATKDEAIDDLLWLLGWEADNDPGGYQEYEHEDKLERGR